MENKYFTPDIEDFCIGYECEICTPTRWKSGKFPEILELNSELDEFGKDSLMKTAHAILRVPYLTKEQIEAEGWEFINHHAGTEHYDFEKNGYSLYVDFDFKGEVYLKIYDGEQDNEFNYFSGKCKDINIFRKICKLLEI